MAAKKEKKAKGGEVSEPAASLTLDVGEGIPPIEYPPTVVGALRRMLTRLDHERHSVLTQERQLPTSIAIMATVSGEGVTYISLALACTLAADTERNYCVVELNWWRPGMIQLLPGIKPDGIGAILTSGAAMDDVLVPTRRPNLTLLPSGIVPLELRAAATRGARLREIMQELGKRYHHVLIDIPAFTMTSDAIPLAYLAATGCMVIRQGAVPIAATKRAIAEVDHLTLLGAVLNRAKSAMPRGMSKNLLSE